jgi:phosphoserine phosphatase
MSDSPHRAALDALVAELDAFPPGEALFDMDGTLITHDIAESSLARIDRMGHRNAVTAGHTSVLEYYFALPDYVDQCLYAGSALGGLTRGQVEAIVDDAFASGDNAPVDAVCELAHRLARRHRVWLLTGSPEILGEIVAKRLGLERWYGIRLRQDGDRLGTATYGVTTCGPGKVLGAWVITGRVPVFAIGDSPFDLPLLRHAKVARTCGKSAGVEFPAFPG